MPCNKLYINCYFYLHSELCSYNGVLFKQGDRWDDGCDLQCICEDDMTGYYRCSQRYASILFILLYLLQAEVS